MRTSRRSVNKPIHSPTNGSRDVRYDVWMSRRLFDHPTMGGGASSAKPKRTPSYPAYMTETAPFPTRTTRRSQSSSDAAPKDAHHRARASKEERKHRLSGYSHNGSIGSMNGNGNGVEAWLEGGPGSLPGTPTRSPGSFGRHGSGGGGDLKRATSGASSDRLGSGGEAGEVVQQRTYAMVLCNRLEEEQVRAEARLIWIVTITTTLSP